MRAVEPPRRLPAPPAELGRLGGALSWLAHAQGSWPPHAPVNRRAVDLAGGGLAAGTAAADALADSGADLLTVEGPPANAAALTALCALLDLEPVAAVGTAVDAGWSELVVAVRDGLPAARAAVGEPERLAEDADLGHAAGLLAQCAVRRTPVVLGSSSLLAAAALVADRIAPGARRWWLAGSQADGSAARLAYADLDLEPLLDLGLTVPGAAGLAADLLVGGISLTASG
jgi:nicotinate-nucleotide--dimethylbenzimidazole phosphoribosyltransferase